MQYCIKNGDSLGDDLMFGHIKEYTTLASLLLWYGTHSQMLHTVQCEITMQGCIMEHGVKWGSHSMNKIQSK